MEKSILPNKMIHQPGSSEKRHAPVNTLYLGISGSGKTNRLLEELCRLMPAPKCGVLLLGEMPSEFEGRFRAVECYAAGRRHAAADLTAAFDRLIAKASGECRPLVVLDEGAQTPPALQARVNRLLRADQITLWTTFESLDSVRRHWNFSLLKYFRDFYFFAVDERSRSYFRRAELFEALRLNDMKAPFYFADKTARDFFTVEDFKAPRGTLI